MKSWCKEMGQVNLVDTNAEVNSLIKMISHINGVLWTPFSSHELHQTKFSQERTQYFPRQNDSNLKSFDSSLHQRTNIVMRSLAESQSISQGSLMEVYGYLLDLNRDVVSLIIESREDVINNKYLSSLVDVYFKNTSKTLDFCNTVQNCVKKAEISKLIIRYAVKLFEAESVGIGENNNNNNNKNKYAKTLAELNKFKAMGDPFEGEFETQYESVYEQQVLLLEELRNLKAKLDKKQRNLEIWRKLSNVVFATAFVSILVLSVVAAAVVAPQVLIQVASGLTTPIEVVGKWCNEMWNKYEKAVKIQIELVSKVEAGAKVNNVATENIRFEVEQLRIKILFILNTIEIGVEEEEEVSTRLAMQEIMKKVDGLTDKIEEVGESAAKCSKLIGYGRFLVLQHILGLPTNSHRLPIPYVEPLVNGSPVG
ncbi:unnamed protein product [Brassica oleracea var. botrytis]|uniref:(rape) hypothetical protein n=1 Tax=Brassica napus TaxID=3708 RepID=A0A816M9Y1_BRANA|nr:unnamed protein product [Brassica napus]